MPDLFVSTLNSHLCLSITRRTIQTLSIRKVLELVSLIPTLNSYIIAVQELQQKKGSIRSSSTEVVAMFEYMVENLTFSLHLPWGYPPCSATLEWVWIHLPHQIKMKFKPSNVLQKFVHKPTKELRHVWNSFWSPNWSLLSISFLNLLYVEAFSLNTRFRRTVAAPEDKWKTPGSCTQLLSIPQCRIN